MNRTRTVSTLLFSCAALLLLLAACGGGSPENLRGMYTARLNGFLIQKQEAAAPEVYAEEGAELMVPEGEEAAAAGGGVGGEEMAAPVEMEPANPDIMLDILIQHDSPTLLPGITVDITHVDGDKNPKGAWQVWFDTSTVKKANVTQYTHVLEDVPYEEGDGFFAEIRHPVPADERHLYRELAGSG